MTIEWSMIYGVKSCKCVDHDYVNSYYVVDDDAIVHDADDYDDANEDTW